MSHRHRTAALAAVLATALPVGVFAQSELTVPPVVVTDQPGPSATESLTISTTERALEEVRLRPGAVTVVPDSAFANGPAATVKDMLDYVPGVWAQPKWGHDTRLSIRGSGLPRNFHLRSLQLYMDGIPINTADGYGDFQEFDPTAYSHVAVHKGGNALKLGGNALGGAIDFVTRSGRDASIAAGGVDVGSYGYRRGQVSSGAASDDFDYFATGSWETRDGLRDHSDGESRRASANIGWRITPDAETRFYVNAADVDQRIPGAVTKSAALDSPETAAAGNVAGDWQRNIETVRVANKTTLRLGTTTVDLGFFGLDRHLMHPIFQWLDYRYEEYGGFARIADERSIAGHKNRFAAGVGLHNGTTDNRQYANIGGEKGALLSASADRSQNYTFYADNAFYVIPSVAVVGSVQYLNAVRDREDEFLSDGDQSGRSAFGLWSPKIGLLWEVDENWQIFGNVSRSAEVPSFGEGTALPPAQSFTAIDAQTATTWEIGTRGERTGWTWDVTLYRAEIRNELQCLLSAFGNCNVTNADRTIHQGVEAALGLGLASGLFVPDTIPDRLWLDLAYTFNDFRFDGDSRFGDNELPGAPRHYLRAQLLYKHPSGFYAGPNVEWVPEAYYVDSANTLETDPYAIFGFRAGYDDGGWISAYVEGRNLADTAYIASTSIIDVATAASALFEPGDGRAVYAGVRMRW